MPLTIVGFLLGFTIFIVAILTGTHDARIFLNPHGLAIVLGGTLSAAFIGFPFAELLRLTRTTWLIFRRPEEDYRAIIQRFGEWAELTGKKGLSALEPELEKLPESFLRDGLELLLNGYGREDLKENLESSLKNFILRERIDASIYKTMAQLAPAFGLVGTLIGLIIMLRNLKDVGSIGPAMSTAMTATFYGVISANLVFLPVSVKLTRRIEFKSVSHRMILDGFLMIYDKRHPLFVMDRMNTYMAPRNRVKLERPGRESERTAKVPKGAAKAPGAKAAKA